MKRILQFGIFLFFYLSLSVAFNACCLEDNYSRLKGIMHFTSWQPEQNLNPYSDTITTPFQLYLHFETENIVQYQQANLLPVVYAFQPCPRTIVNPIDHSSIKLILDKDFLFVDDTIKKGTSLLDLEGIRLDSYIDYEYGMNIRIDSSFLEQARFDKEWYNFSISMMNFDTIPELFTAELPLFLDLE